MALVTVAVGLSLPAVAQNTFSGKVTRVEQGDRVVVQLETWQLTVRLHGAECVSTVPFAEIARDWTATRLLGKSVSVHVRGTAAKGVVYGDVLYPPKESNVAIELVEQGLATWARGYAPDRSDLSAAERRAQRERDGVWGNAEVQAIRLQRLLREMKSEPAKTRNPKPTVLSSPTPRLAATPSASPETTLSPTKPTPRAFLLMPLLFGILVSGGLLLLAERLSREGRQLRARPILLVDAPEDQWIKTRGLAAPRETPLVSVVGRIPALYLREITKTFRDGAWHTTYDETDGVPFVLDDGLDQAQVDIEKAVYKPIRVARFYNDIPVEKWHARSYSGDIRTEIFFIPPDVTVTVYGTYHSNPKRLEPRADGKWPVTIVEGDERRLTRIPLQVALSLVVFALIALGTGIWLTVWYSR